jgi:hypothetical protein
MAGFSKGVMLFAPGGWICGAFGAVSLATHHTEAGLDRAGPQLTLALLLIGTNTCIYVAGRLRALSEKALWWIAQGAGVALGALWAAAAGGRAAAWVLLFAMGLALGVGGSGWRRPAATLGSETAGAAPLRGRDRPK